MKSRIDVYVFMLLTIFVSGCELFYKDTDTIGQAHKNSLKILKQYEKDSNSVPVQSWLFAYHGEAQGHQAFITLAEWSFENQHNFIKLIENVPIGKKQEFISRYAFAVTDSGAKAEFYKAFDAIHSELLFQIRSKINQM